LVPQHVTFNWPADPRALRVVVPVDGTVAGELALDPAADLAQATGGQVILAAAFAPPPPGGEPADYAAYDPVEAAEAARTSLAPLVTQLAGRGVQSEIYVGEGEPSDVILDAARDYHAHLIAMATHGRRGLARLVMGSVADAVLRQTRVALLLVRTTASTEIAEWEGESEREEAPAAAPEAGVAERPVAVLMTATEIDLAHEAIARGLRAGAVEGEARSGAQELLDRLAVARGAPVASTSMPEPAG
jgi:nucleotide-binding universal stress UspA family protein